MRDSLILGIFDIDESEVSEATAKTLADLEKSGSVDDTACGGELPKCFVFTVGGRAYLSPIASATLARRKY